jgi:rare lipoprotein A
MRVARTCQFGKAGRYALLGRKTANGEMLDSVTATAAHRSLPLASLARVTDLENGRTVIVKINDRGPYVRGRIIDLSPRAADALHMKAAGVAAVVVQPVSNPAETNHRSLAGCGKGSPALKAVIPAGAQRRARIQKHLKSVDSRFRGLTIYVSSPFLHQSGADFVG